MGYSLELYNLAPPELARTLASGDTAFLEEVRAKQGPVLGFADEAQRAEWESKLRELLTGNTGKVLAAHGFDPAQSSAPEVSDALALAFAAAVRTKGEFIGDLRHSSMAGRTFREQFLAKDAPAA